MTARAALRAATDAAHQRVDAYFSRLDLADPDDYARFLLAQASAFLPVEQAIHEAGASLVITDWDSRRRSTLLLGDLEALGLTPPAPCEPPAYDSEAAIWGGAYVLEGSRLGGALLKRDVPGKMPRTFLDAPSPKGSWRHFIADLERNLVSDVQRNLAGQKAVETFACFMPSGTTLEDE
ncbi:biliverdin-producing heme oxygenase [Sphingomonas sp. LY160]|uniref:biliverdin-producing heme oxygenase n=1 Tax=Sphingomonas sp. LY160 TaxID=3095342 RepID=UPI002ADEC000|nr:biliverdin-producing heme oxygenase [Sphingomonas sp. LY160]MEA1071614.1 biliverdin-producing heme oxygenase [Sphingomonas sp. LY160]